MNLFSSWIFFGASSDAACLGFKVPTDTRLFGATRWEPEAFDLCVSVLLAVFSTATNDDVATSAAFGAEVMMFGNTRTGRTAGATICVCPVC
jgi:hypothetical protein